MKVLPWLPRQKRFTANAIIPLQFAHIALLLTLLPRIKDMTNNAFGLFINLNAILRRKRCMPTLKVDRAGTSNVSGRQGFFVRQSELLFDG